MSTIKYNANAGMERIFAANSILSDDLDYEVYFDLIDPLTAKEKRQLRIVKIATSEAILIVDINSNGGVKPLKNRTIPYMPNVRPILRYNQLCTPELERIFYAECDLTDTPGVDIKFCIDLFAGIKDARRYLVIDCSGPDLPSELSSIEIELVDGKKPLEGEIRLRQNEESE